MSVDAPDASAAGVEEHDKPADAAEVRAVSAATDATDATDSTDARERKARGQDKGGPAAREKALEMLAELIAEGGAKAFLLPPVIPGEEAFPDPWAHSAAAVKLLIRRLAWYAAIECDVVIDDRRAGAPPTERKPSTRAELVAVRGKEATFALGFIGTDDVVGTLALEVGTLYALTHRPDLKEPYRTPEAPPNAEHDVVPLRTVDAARDHARGAVAAVYCGLGVLAANAAYQQYVSPGRFNGIYVPHEYDVIKAGALPMSTMTYLVAVQAIVRGETEPPKGLSQSQHHEVAGYLKTLAKERTVLCERLGIDSGNERTAKREKPVPFVDAGEVKEDVPRKNAWRWQTNRGGLGFVAGTVLGLGFAFVISRGMMPFTTFGGATVGHLVGRRVRTPRCSACATIVRVDAATCWKCGAALRGDIASLGDRLEAEERLELEQRKSKSSAPT